MRTSKYSPEQISPALKQVESCTAILDTCRKLEITEQTFYWCKKQSGDLSTSKITELRHLREENRNLKQLVADLSLDKTILHEAIKKSVTSTDRCKLISWA